MIFPKISLNIEKWKFNKDYGVYVSNMGHFKDRYKRNMPIKINSKGYCGIVTEVSPFILAHRIVMLTWCPISNAKNLTVDHLDHNKRNNAVKNLEWVTAKENLTRAKIDFIGEQSIKKKNNSLRRQKCKQIFEEIDFQNHFFVLYKGEEVVTIFTPEQMFNCLIKMLPGMTVEDAKSKAKKIRKLLNNENLENFTTFGKKKNKIKITMG